MTKKRIFSTMKQKVKNMEKGKRWIKYLKSQRTLPVDFLDKPKIVKTRYFGRESKYFLKGEQNIEL